ncbi:VCBS repeat-containing protein [Acidobacteria bacterium AH-259-L09]|nr:VCBS repeat-containing protein [Acidobacteria bacterium AH-259-L09]
MRFSIALLLSGCFLYGADKPSDPVQFRPHVIEAKIPRGYAVLVTDINNDRRPDVLGLTSRLTELAWYENPTWERHVLIQNMSGLVNMAAHDVDGDGIPELAVENGFSMVAAKSRGLVWLLQHQGDPRKPWKATHVDELTTSHHVAWADIDGDGEKELINAPLIGSKALAPKYEDRVPLVYYYVPNDVQDEWKRLLIDDQLSGVLHRVRVVQWNEDKREELLTAGFDGIVLHQASGEGDQIHWENALLSRGHEEEPPRAGASDVAVGRLNKSRMLASVEPWHGNEVVIYTQDTSGRWQRRIIYDQLKEGHEVCVGDFNGDGRDDIVAGDRGRGEIASSHIFYAQDDAGTQWQHEVLDHLGMSASGCSVADINGDGRLDIVQIGSATENIKWYENLGRARR